MGTILTIHASLSTYTLLLTGFESAYNTRPRGAVGQAPLDPNRGANTTLDCLPSSRVLRGKGSF